MERRRLPGTGVSAPERLRWAIYWAIKRRRTIFRHRRIKIFRKTGDLYGGADWYQVEQADLRAELEDEGIPMGYGRVGRAPRQLEDVEVLAQFESAARELEKQHGGGDSRSSARCSSRVMSCPHHELDACCPECPGHKAKDWRGFPHPSEAKGRTRLKQCTRCLRYVDSASWVHKAKMAPNFYGCVECHVRLKPESVPSK